MGFWKKSLNTDVTEKMWGVSGGVRMGVSCSRAVREWDIPGWVVGLLRRGMLWRPGDLLW